MRASMPMEFTKVFTLVVMDAYSRRAVTPMGGENLSKRWPNDPVAAAQALSFYRGLYDIEDRMRDASPEERLEIRQSESLPIALKFHAWLTEKNNDLTVLPKSSLSKAVRYVLNQWDEMMAFLSNGDLPIDTGATENELRRLTIGRKNWCAPDVLSRTSGRFVGSGGLVGNVVQTVAV